MHYILTNLSIHMSPDKEIAAMNDIVASLSSLSNDEKARVINYITGRFGISPIASKTPLELTHPPVVVQELNSISPAIDIRSLKEQKKPSSHVQMVVLLGYYLKACAPAEERKETITANDIEKYFTQAAFPLPAGKNGAADTLNNAKKAGYLEPAGSGAYRLNSVGFNLAAYGMPNESGTRKPVTKPRATAKKVAKKKK